ncbi:hypothetical protein DWG14_05093 [Streptomyces griseorubiginosus]|uniref:Uncharacterized protein n=1 Tax=Streptomyces griseorubiginosus TaxID=67304 RepID=A0AAI8PQ62_9ACTN|nr:hypothetical protein DWG14_05093 [Streptomyces griseorubiginosus]
MALLQTFMRYASRKPPSGSTHSLKIDDAIFYIDWIVTSAVALGYSMVTVTMDGDPKTQIETPTVVVALLVLVVGVAMLPPLVRDTCYDATGKIKGWWHVVVLDLIGLTFLASSVVAGVKTYGS